MSDIKLNLARKWRSRTFDQVVGQELPIRMLKNSLYLDYYFPVYLFSGQRGCGKTTAARIFAGAVNCEKLTSFQKNPKEVIPCLSCQSCLAMKKGNHPDFIEIDAASHTGVDNVRQIIDAAALLPLLGRKKIYLIDEAHMLSKAAFNAFLKILEEPPESVFFILATTDPQKIIDTVTSRCFQVFFKAIPAQPLVNHLAYVCKKEEIEFEEDALQILVKQTEGSVRDALNLLEQVRFTVRRVSKQAITMVLGHLDEERLLSLFDKVMNASAQDLLSYLQEIDVESYSASMLWHAFIELLRTALWHKYGVARVTNERLATIIQSQSPALLTGALQIFYDYELVFLKTKAQHRVFEHVLLHINDPILVKKIEPNIPPIKQQIKVASKATLATNAPESNSKEWATFLEKVVVLDDPLVLSVFKQGVFIAHQAEEVTVSFPENLSFFNELIENTANTWKPLLAEIFGPQVKMVVSFNGQAKAMNVEQPKVEQTKQVAPSTRPMPEQRQSYKQSFAQKRSFTKPKKKSIERAIDVSDEVKWKKTNIILKVFPGTVTEIPKDGHA